MNETEINLVREYVHIHYLIKEAVAELDELKLSRISLSGLLVSATKSTGAKLKEKLKDVQKELRTAGIFVKIEDDGGEIIFVCTVKNRVEGRYGIKRVILREEMEKKLMEYANEFMVSDLAPYKVELTFGDPYANK